MSFFRRGRTLDRLPGISVTLQNATIEEALKNVSWRDQPIDTRGDAFEDLLTCLISSIFRTCMPKRSALQPDYAPGWHTHHSTEQLSELCGEIIRKTSQGARIVIIRCDDRTA